MSIGKRDLGDDNLSLDDTDMEILALPEEADTDDDDKMNLDDSSLTLVVDHDSGIDDESYSDDTDFNRSSPTLKTGSYTKWHEGDPLLRKIGLEKLNDRGYVNLEAICTDRTFGYPGDRALNAARWRAKYEVQIGLCSQIIEEGKKKGKYGKLDKFHRIHPIFRQDNWTSDDLLMGDESNCSFNKLKPVLQLATLLLEDETMVGYIFNMLDVDSHKEVTFAGVENRLRRNVYGFQQRHNLSGAERQIVWKDLCELSKTLWWTEKDMTFEKESFHAYTRGEQGTIEIVLDKRHLDYVCREVSPTEDAIDWKPGSDDDSARLRVMFNLATTMIHEVMHALWRNKYYPDYEPFYMDTRAAELGFQWEQLLYSGQIDNPTSDRGSPYILSISKWPSPGEKEDSPTILMSHKKWGSSNAYQEFAVEMSFVQNMFTDEFWAEVDRYGISKFWPRRMLGVRSTVVSEYWEAESPIVRGPTDGRPSSPDGADSKGIIDRH
ncbi:hypothetical protein QM012_003373 [Aureobasidium pullulans]|uniref:SprT-like domain-containing protein n=1 Tax=Aureobasidium pullulans TaxID=5580 RepID=A0ABR0T879_AURPU